MFLLVPILSARNQLLRALHKPSATWLQNHYQKHKVSSSLIKGHVLLDHSFQTLIRNSGSALTPLGLGIKPFLHVFHRGQPMS